ncbi:MAG: ABC transporter permease [Deltaproteobacteria bacterium]|nr:ABC transporter permease [Deltaproteobacteria bacterium]
MGGTARYLLGRLGFYLLAAWVALSLNFLIPRMMPGDPATVMFARFQGQLSPEAMDALRETFGLSDASWWSQYWTYLRHALVGDFGTSVAYFPEPVTGVLLRGLFWTVVLAGSAVVVAFAAGTLLGTLAAWRRGGWLDSVLPPVLALLGAFPYFWLAMLALFVLGFGMGLFPLRHAYSDQLTPGLSPEFLASVFRHTLLPALTLVAVSLGGWMLAMRNTMIGVLGSDFIEYAHARGLAPRRVMLAYAARNAILPNVTGFGMALGFVLGGALLTEIIFSYPVQGYLLIQSVRAQDYPLMQGLFLTISLAVLAANWFVDCATVALDPRTRR